ncbi:hypothetical protein [Bacillus cabrialesii]|nr:hypothetical protein [Bacillus cabrialesii]MDU0153579.1 hypothetical protein [Bacillus cabrialesii]
MDYDGRGAFGVYKKHPIIPTEEPQTKLQVFANERLDVITVI